MPPFNPSCWSYELLWRNTFAASGRWRHKRYPGHSVRRCLIQVMSERLAWRNEISAQNRSATPASELAEKQRRSIYGRFRLQCQPLLLLQRCYQFEGQP